MNDEDLLKYWSQYYFGSEDYKAMLDTLPAYDGLVRAFEQTIKEAGVQYPKEEHK